MIDCLINLFQKSFPNLEPKTVLDCGCNNGETTDEFLGRFPQVRIVACEADPRLAQHCQSHFSGNQRVVVIPKAISEIDGEIVFYKSACPNPGIGSIFAPTKDYPFEDMSTTQITVSSIRLEKVMDELGIEGFDILWLDMQGGELALLKSMGDKLKNTKAIWSEFTVKSMYQGQPLESEVNCYLESFGFKRVFREEWIKQWWGDFCYIKC